MNQELYNFKVKLLETGLFKRVSGHGQYKIKECPFCGDKKWHMYVLIDITTDTPVKYNCFKCNSHGSHMTEEFLKYYGLDEDISIPKYKGTKNLRISSNVKYTNDVIFVNENDDLRGISEYIFNRVGKYPTIDELKAFGYVSNPFKYVKEYLGEIWNNREIFKNRYWFRLSNGGIIGRWKDNNCDERWMRYRCTKIRKSGLYTLKIPFEMNNNITVYIAEGIMDIIGLYYNYPGENCCYIACMGKNYMRGINHVLGMGIFGKSVSIKIFKDKDVGYVNIDPYISKLFKRIDIYENMLDKDFGVLPEHLGISKIINERK